MRLTVNCAVARWQSAAQNLLSDVILLSFGITAKGDSEMTVMRAFLLANTAIFTAVSTHASLAASGRPPRSCAPVMRILNLGQQ